MYVDIEFNLDICPFMAKPQMVFQVTFNPKNISNDQIFFCDLSKKFWT